MITRTEDPLFNELWSLTLGFKKQGGGNSVHVIAFDTLERGTPVDVILADGTRWQLNTATATGTTTGEAFGVYFAHHVMQFSLTPDQAAALASSPIEAFRVMRGAEAWYSGATDEHDAELLAEAVKCMLGP